VGNPSTWWIALLLAVTIGWCDAALAGPQEDCGDDMDCLRGLYDNHPVKNVKTLHAYQALPFERRVVVAPKKIRDYINLDNRLNGVPNQPKRARVEPQFMEDLEGALADLPEPVKNLVDSRLMGIFLVQDLGGTGLMDNVYNDNGESVGAFVVLDVDVLNRMANEWATWKENTPFQPDPEFDLQARIETAPNDDRKQALQYIILHELGHVASIGRHIHPPWDDWDCVKDPPELYPFFQLSWELKNEQDCEVVSKFDASGFSYREQVVYYFGAQLELSKSPAVYGQLEQTNFPSLYAATSSADDFAESFVTYVHSVLMGRPFEILIDRNGERQATFTGCWGEPRCAEKQTMMAKLFSPDN